MKVTALLTLAAGFAAAAPAPAAAPEPEKEHALQKRLSELGVAIVGGTISGAITTAIVGLAVGVAAKQINDVIDALETWERVREEFTQKTVAEMWANRPGDEYAAICYNMAYSVSNTQNIVDGGKVELTSGPLKTDYDCFLMKGPDTRFTPEGDGGFINYAAQHNDAYCTYDDASGEIYCK
ncbi:hypothetical protein B0J12DRAFT_698287 [Macrophomina phaseolina]|uniref:DUF7888 domain-containing protein n=1 Tax=Macrophomina phaseolina TaxID=35725 RepID=A0ABQ8GDQ6_9PEZI|nr:hypothetical protein B0J12DRAFT_698287 [Macrophomina phaseolina]